MNNNQAPEWAIQVSQGNFAEAENHLTAQAAQRIQVQAALEQANQAAGYAAKYLQPRVTQLVQEEVAAGKIQSPAQLVERYQQTMGQEIRNFKSEVRPGYERDRYNPSTPADAEVSDYIAERKAQAEHLRTEGRKLPGLLSR